jgi:hypothetical protein
VWSAIRDLENCALPEKEKALLRFVGKVNHQSPSICAEDMQPLYGVGWTDEAIYSVITVCALFNFLQSLDRCHRRSPHVRRSPPALRRGYGSQRLCPQVTGADADSSQFAVMRRNERRVCGINGRRTPVMRSRQAPGWLDTLAGIASWKRQPV